MYAILDSEQLLALYAYFTESFIISDFLCMSNYMHRNVFKQASFIPSASFQLLMPAIGMCMSFQKGHWAELRAHCPRPGTVQRLI